MTHYDYLIVGSGLFGATFAYRAKHAGKRCLVIDKRPHLGGNVYCENIEGINVHKYGAHIFLTNNKKVWEYVNQFAEFNRYTNSPVANYRGELYSLPFNMYTFNKMWGVVTPEEAAEKIEEKQTFKIANIINYINETGLLYSPSLIKRFAFSLMAKRFLILSGLAGSGKTQLALAFAKALVEDKEKQMYETF